MKISIKKSIFNFINIFILVVLWKLMFVNWNLSSNIDWEKSVSIIALFLIVYYLFFFNINHVKITNFAVWFFLLHFLFIFGRIFLVALDMDANLYWNLFVRYSEVAQRQAAYFALVAIQSMFCGYFLFSFNKSERHSIDAYEIDSRKMFYTGVVLMAITLPMKLYSDTAIIIESRATGSYVNISSVNGIVSSLSLLVGIGVLFVICSGELTKRAASRFLLFVAIYYAITMVLTGDRRYAVTAMISYILCYLVKYKIKVRFSTVIGLLFIAYITVVFLTTITEVRRENNVGIVGFLSAFWGYVVSGKIFYRLLAEFGTSFFSVVNVTNYIPSTVHYLKGKTILSAIISVIPGSGRLFTEFIEGGTLSTVFFSINNLGVGGSIIADLYGNFGKVAPIFGVLVGVLLAKIFNERKRELSNYNLAMYYSFFYLFLNLIRCDFGEILRPIVFGVVLVFVIYRSRR